MINKEKELIAQVDLTRMPRHIGIIMDGNGRWASKRMRPRLFGHQEGAKSIRRVVEICVELKLKYLTFYAFSTENWNRPEDEVKGLLKLLKERLIKENPELNKQNIYVQFIGTKERLEPDYLADIQKMAEMTHKNTGMTVNIAFNYGGRQEIGEAIKALTAEEILALTPENMNKYLWTKGQPDPDLIIRTSGEHRLSNFKLRQSSNSENYITDDLWPDKGKNDMLASKHDYQN